MHVPAYYEAQLRAEKQTGARPPADGEPDAAPAPSSREEAAPSVPPGAVFDLGRAVRRVAPFVLLFFLGLAACEGGPAGSGATPPAPGPVVSLARWSPVAEGLDRADVGDGLVCFRARTESHSGSADGVAVSCVRVAPMQWQVAPGPKLSRAGAEAGGTP